MQFRAQLEPQPADWQGGAWPGRKRGSYQWYELQDPVDYWKQFAKPKIMYPTIAKTGEFCLDTTGFIGADTTYSIPVDDYFLLGALNTRAVWFAFSGISIPFGERAGEFRYRLFNQYVEQIPIPKPTDAQRAEVEAAVRRLIELTGERQAGRAAVLGWLRAEFGVEKPSLKLQDPAGLDPDAFVAEVKKGRKKGLGVAEVKRLREEHAKSVVPLRQLAREADGLERRVSDVVNAAFGLTPDEVRLMWDTAPPRMPVGRPTPPGA